MHVREDSPLASCGDFLIPRGSKASALAIPAAHRTLLGVAEQAAATEVIDFTAGIDPHHGI